MRTRRSHTPIAAALALCAFSWAGGAMAEEPAGAPAPGNWTMTFGGAAVAQPSWLGSDTLAISGAPRFNLRAPGAPKRFNSFDDGISPGFDVGMFRIGPNIAFVPERDPSSEADLNGLNRVDFTLEAGAFAEVYPVSWLRLRGAARYGFFGHEGINGNIGADLVWQPTDNWTLAAGPRANFADQAFTRSYFGVSPTESAASGLPAFNPQGGLYGAGLSASATYAFDNGFSITGFAGYDRLLGDAARSPLVRQRGSADQFMFGTSLTYTFGVDW